VLNLFSQVIPFPQFVHGPRHAEIYIILSKLVEIIQTSGVQCEGILKVESHAKNERKLILEKATVQCDDNMPGQCTRVEDVGN
jgi:hypothetical protein